MTQQAALVKVCETGNSGERETGKSGKTSPTLLLSLRLPFLRLSGKWGEWRAFLLLGSISGFLLLAGCSPGRNSRNTVEPKNMKNTASAPDKQTSTLFLSGDVMTGRGIDQLFPTSVDPQLHESYVKNAERYVQLGIRENGNIDRPVTYDYIWGDALSVWKSVDPDFRIINLETSITSSDDFWQGKGINYRMHPENVKCLTTASIDACVLANNHVLDWGVEGLRETLSTLDNAGIAYTGAGRNSRQALNPMVFPVDDSSNMLIFSYGLPTSGIPQSWAAGEEHPGVNRLPDLSAASLQQVQADIAKHATENDLVICSVHWGGNWGYAIPEEQRRFAKRLIEEAGVDLLHGHSSHHPMGMEVYRERLILYGCGDLLNDYEGIGGHQEYRPELSLMYFPVLDKNSGALLELRMAPMEIKQFQLNRATDWQSEWLAERLTREGETLGTTVKKGNNGFLLLEW